MPVGMWIFNNELEKLYPVIGYDVPAVFTSELQRIDFCQHMARSRTHSQVLLWLKPKAKKKEGVGLHVHLYLQITS